MKLLLISLAFAYLVGSIEAQQVSQAEIIAHRANLKRNCIKEVEASLGHIKIDPKIRQLLATIRKHHPNGSFVEIIEPVDTAMEALKKLGYPKECDDFLMEFSLKKDQATCMNDIKFDDEFRQMIGQNKRVDELLGASSVCFLSSELDS